MSSSSQATSPVVSLPPSLTPSHLASFRLLKRADAAAGAPDNADANSAGPAEDDPSPSADTSDAAPEQSGKDPTPKDDAGNTSLLRQAGQVFKSGAEVTGGVVKNASSLALDGAGAVVEGTGGAISLAGEAAAGTGKVALKAGAGIYSATTGGLDLAAKGANSMFTGALHLGAGAGQVIRDATSAMTPKNSGQGDSASDPSNAASSSTSKDDVVPDDSTVNSGSSNLGVGNMGSSRKFPSTGGQGIMSDLGGSHRGSTANVGPPSALQSGYGGEILGPTGTGSADNPVYSGTINDDLSNPYGRGPSSSAKSQSKTPYTRGQSPLVTSATSSNTPRTQQLGRAQQVVKARPKDVAAQQQMRQLEQARTPRTQMVKMKKQHASNSAQRVAGIEEAKEAAKQHQAGSAAAIEAHQNLANLKNKHAVASANEQTQRHVLASTARKKQIQNAETAHALANYPPGSKSATASQEHIAMLKKNHAEALKLEMKTQRNTAKSLRTQKAVHNAEAEVARHEPGSPGAKAASERANQLRQAHAEQLRKAKEQKRTDAAIKRQRQINDTKARAQKSSKATEVAAPLNAQTRKQAERTERSRPMQARRPRRPPARTPARQHLRPPPRGRQRQAGRMHTKRRLPDGY
jgi:hypothetical protein